MGKHIRWLTAALLLGILFTVLFSCSNIFGDVEGQRPKKTDGETTDSYIVTFDKNNSDSGSTEANPRIMTVTAPATTISSMPAAPMRPAYTFIGWNTEADGSGLPFDSITPVSASITVFAQWVTQDTDVFTISFISKGGSEIPDRYVVKDGKISQPENPTRNAYAFAGWFKDEECTEPWNFLTDTVSDDITLYAQWTALTGRYLVRFIANGGSTVPPDQAVSPGEKASEPVIGRLDHTFGGWYRDVDRTIPWFFDRDTVNSAVILYAKWNADGKYTVNFSANEGTPAWSNVEVSYGTTVAEPVDIIRTGYRAEWYSDISLDTVWNFTSMIVIGNTTLYAEWTPIDYTVAYDKNAADATGAMANSSHTYDEAKVLNANAYTRSGCTFTGWARTKEGTPEFTDEESVLNLASVDGAMVTLYAVWEVNVPLISSVLIVPYLDKQSGGNNSETEIYLPLSLQLTEANWKDILEAIHTAGKYVGLDLTACTGSGSDTGGGLRSDGAFDPVYSFEEGKGRIVSINLPDTATSIISGLGWIDHKIYTTFEHFINLKTFSGAGLTSIGDWAFMGCPNLASIELPAGLTYIGHEAFVNCTSLVQITLPAGLDYFGYAPFANCSNLAIFDIIGTGSLSTIAGRRALVLNGTYLVAYPTASGSITLPGGLTGILHSAFFRCVSLTQIALPAGLSGISNYSFSGCTNLVQITLPAEITNIGSGAFNGCADLTFYLTGSGPLSTINDNRALVLNGTDLLAYPSASGSVTLPDGLTYIYHEVFTDCNNLTEITLPEEIAYIGYQAFLGCTSLALVRCHAVNPPELGTYLDERFTFEYTPSNMQIKVPAASVDAYKLAEGWSEYADRISAID